MTWPREVIIFNATGAIATTTAQTASSKGAKVTLATPTSITTLPNQHPKQIYADLSKPSTLITAIHNTGAIHAFIPTISTNIRPALQALKESGIESILLLSSFSFTADGLSRTNFVPYRHADAEIAVQEIFGSNGVIVRPAYCASIALQMRPGILAGEVRLPNPDAVLDWIVPEDVGRVCGSILAGAPCERVVSLVGPQLLSLDQVVGSIGRVIGKEMVVKRIEVDEAVVEVCSKGFSVEMARVYVGDMVGVRRDISLAPAYRGALGNVVKYTGREPIRFQTWLEENRKLFE